MNKAKVDPNKIHLLAIKILKAHFEVDGDLMDSNIKLGDYKVDLSSTPGFSLEEKLVRFRLNIALSGYDTNGNEIGVKGSYCIDYTFQVENLQEFIYPEEDIKTFSVDDNLVATIAGISYSTSRGIILDRTQATEFNGVLLPVIDPYQLFEHTNE